MSPIVQYKLLLLLKAANLSTQLNPALIAMQENECVQQKDRLDFWLSESQFYQHLLLEKSVRIKSEYDQRRFDSLQNRLDYLKNQLLPEYAARVEQLLQELEKLSLSTEEDGLDWFKQQASLAADLNAFELAFRNYKQEAFDFIQHQ